MTEENHFGKYPLRPGSTIVSKVIKTDRDHRMPKNFVRVGIMTDNKPDLFDLLGEVSPSSYKMFLRLKRIRTWEMNMATLPPPLNKSEATVQSRALKELIAVGLIKKVPVRKLKSNDGLDVVVPKRTYILNPIHLYPTRDPSWTKVMDFWEQL